jgi:NAD(P)-dependent dehydrogenase (short-subunit alcohol dehydrogenase family)
MKRRWGWALGALAAGTWLSRRPGELNLAGRTVVITGGSRGLGFLLAREFGRRGARLALCARGAEGLERARAALAEEGIQALIARVDVSQRGEVQDFIALVRDQLGPVDVLVNNASVMVVGPLEEMTEADYAESMAVHFWGPLHTTLAVLDDMRNRRSGRIVNISSIGGRLSVPHLLPYAAGKFALTGLSQGLRAELARHKVKVTTVIPGLMRTGSPLEADFKGRHRAEYAWFSTAAVLPLTSISADRAARRIVQACVRGKAEVILSPQAKLAAWAHGLFPGLVANALGLVNRALPGPGGIGQARAKGASSAPARGRWVGRLVRRAARHTNEPVPAYR